MLRGVVLAHNALLLDVAGAVGVPDGLAGFEARRIEGKLIERTVDITRCELREMTGGVVVGADDRAVAVDYLREGETAGRGPVAVEILRDHGLGRLSHHGIAGAGILVIEIPLPEFDALHPTAAFRSPDLKESLVGV